MYTCGAIADLTASKLMKQLYLLEVQTCYVVDLSYDGSLLRIFSVP